MRCSVRLFAEVGGAALGSALLFHWDRRCQGSPLCLGDKMPATVKCPACQRRLSVPSKKLGQVVVCPECETAFAASLRAPDTTAPPNPPEVNEPAFQCPACRKAMDIWGCAPGQLFLCSHCRKPFAIPDKGSRPSEQSSEPEFQLQVAPRHVAAKSARFMDRLLAVVGVLALIALSFFVALAVLPVLGVNINGNRLKAVVYSFAFLFFVTTSAIEGLKKLFGAVQPAEISSTGSRVAPGRHQGAMNSSPNVQMHVGQAANTASMPRHDRPDEQWWLSHAGQVSGPLSTASILSHAQAGRFAPEAKVCRVGDAHWTPILTWLKDCAATTGM
jgi:ribosomal protein L37AE/L43A